MTVAELIEELQRLPGASDLRHVEFRVVVYRPYCSDTEMHCSPTTVSIEHDCAVIRAYGHLG